MVIKVTQIWTTIRKLRTILAVSDGFANKDGLSITTQNIKSSFGIVFILPKSSFISNFCKLFILILLSFRGGILFSTRMPVPLGKIGYKNFLCLKRCKMLKINSGTLHKIPLVYTYCKKSTI